MGILKASMAFIDRQVLSVFEPLFYAFIGTTHHSVFALFNFLHVDSNRAVDSHAILAAAPRDMSSPRACHQRLGRDAAIVDTGTAEPLAFDDRRLQPCAGQPDRERRPRLSSANNDSVIRRCHYPSRNTDQ